MNTSPQQKCADFNRDNPIGTTVEYFRLRSNAWIETKTRSEAYVLSGEDPVVLLEGVSGCYALDCVRSVGEMV